MKYYSIWPDQWLVNEWVKKFHLLNMEIYWGEIKNQFFLTIDPNFLGHPSGSSVNTSDRSESKCKIEMNDSMMHERRYCIIYI